MSTTDIRVLSFNCWDLKYVAKNRKERISAIAEALAASHYDLIGLQELWVYADYERIRNRLANKLRYSKFFYSGALGAGLALFSRYPIMETSIHPYSLNGSPIDVASGDWFVGKSAASIVIDHPTLGEVEVFNTHMYATVGEDGPEERRAHRLVNAWELAKLIRTSARLGRYVIVVGDFNSIPTSLPMTILQEHACLTDAWSQSHGSLPSLQTMLSPQQAVSDHGITADSPLNSYSAGKRLDAIARRQHGKRLDYILFRHPSQRQSNTTTHPILTTTESKVVLTGRVPGYSFPFSDHFGFEATLHISYMDVDASHDIESGALNPMGSTSPDTCISNATLGSLLQALTARYRTSRSQSQLQLILCVVCVGIALVVIVSSPWLPRTWINPIFLFFTVFVSWLGTTMLYSGFIFGKWELNALTNVIEELELLKERGPGTRGSETPLLNPT